MSDWSVAGGEAAKKDAIERVGSHADGEWRKAATYAVYQVALTCEEFTTDDVWKYVETRWPAIATHEHRAMGAIMKDAAKRGFCVATDRQRKTEKKAAHRRPKMVWRSLLWSR